jgi:gluconolactonase
MRIRRSSTILICLVLFTQVAAQPFGNAEKILDGFQFVEGPAVDANGDLYFTDIPPRLIYKFDGDTATVYLDSTWGANGLAFDPQGRLVACAGKDRRCIFRLETDGSRTVLTDSYDGKKLNSPNDLWIDPNGGIYFTDPRYGSTDDMQQDGMHVYYLAPGVSDALRVVDDLERPNGIFGTPDGKTLYVVDEGARKTYRYSIDSPGVLVDKRLFCDGGIDGLALTDKNEVAVTIQHAVVLFSPDGTLLQKWAFENHPTNACFADGVLYVTTQGGQLFQIKL